MTELELSYRLTAETALHVGTGLGFARLVDDLVVRAKSAGGAGHPLPYLPGSTLKGRMRRETERIARGLGIRVHVQGPGERVCKGDPCVVCRLFGSTYREGTLVFSDVCLDPKIARAADPGETQRDPFLLSAVRAGNKLERATRCVERQLLFTRENAAEGLTYEGRISGGVSCRPGDGEGIPVEIWLLLAALRMLEKVGGGRSRGLGRCSVALQALKVDGEDRAGTLEELLCGADAQQLEECALRVAIYAEANPP